jgi:hypothetical protein
MFLICTASFFSSPAALLSSKKLSSALLKQLVVENVNSFRLVLVKLYSVCTY